MIARTHCKADNVQYLSDPYSAAVAVRDRDASGKPPVMADLATYAFGMGIAVFTSIKVGCPPTAMSTQCSSSSSSNERCFSLMDCRWIFTVS